MKITKIRMPISLLMIALTLSALISAYTAYIPTSIVFAASTDSQMQHVYDKAKLFSSDEISDLEEQCITYGEDAGIEIIILTHNDSSAIYAEDYIEDFEDQLPVGDRVYLLIDMYNRDVFIEGYGKAETYIHSKRIDKILDDVVTYLSDGNYYDACLSYIKLSASYMKDDSDLNYDHNYDKTPQSSDPNAPYYDETWPSERNNTKQKSILTNVWLQLFIAIVIGALTVTIMSYSSGGTMTAGSNDYIDKGSSGLIGRRDQYIRTTVTKIKKPSQNNTSSHAKGGFNSSGHRGGSSSSGRSHSSGGRKF